MNEKTILIVDDNLVITKALEFQLKSAGYRTLSASDGGEALNLARNERPGLIIMDINFPPDVAHGGGMGWDGFRIIDWMRRMCGVGDTPIIIITSDRTEKHRERVLAAGAAAIFRKPVDREVLIAKIEECYQRQAPGAGGDTPPPRLTMADG